MTEHFKRIIPAFQKYSRFYNRLCSPKIFGFSSYAVCLGILGTVSGKWFG